MTIARARRVARSGAGRDVGAGHGDPCAGHCATAAILGEPERRAPRMQLFVTGTDKTLSYVLQDGDARPSADSAQRPGATLVLQQAQPTDIVVTNLARRATAVHWHGLELDSYYDGVAGWSGIGTTVAPIIAPGDSFVRASRRRVPEHSCITHTSTS